jgi:hypothetical protein
MNRFLIKFFIHQEEKCKRAKHKLKPLNLIEYSLKVIQSKIKFKKNHANLCEMK